MPLPALLERIFMEMEISSYIMRHREHFKMSEIFQAFERFLKKEFEVNSSFTLEQLNRRIDWMINNHISPLYTIVNGTKSGVHFLSKTELKAPEFDHVFIAGCNDISWANKTETVTDSKIIVEDREPQSSRAELATQKPELTRVDAGFIQSLLDKFVMSVTALNNYLCCPLDFYFNVLLRAPQGRSEAAGFGSAVHFALQRLFEKMKTNPGEAFPSAGEMMADFQSYMQTHKENFTSEAYARRMEYGNVILPNYYHQYVSGWHRIVAIELNIRNVRISGVPVKGMIDKLEFDRKDVRIIDYKTGDVDRALKSLATPSDENPNGGDYWRQAVFYTLLVEALPGKNWKPVTVEFDFIEPDKSNQFRKAKLVITPQDRETVRQQLISTWQKIKAQDFYSGCGKAHCHWCNLVSDNQLHLDQRLYQSPTLSDY